MAEGREPKPDLARFVYVTRFGSHPCGGVLQLGSRRARGRSQEEPREAAAGEPGSGQLHPFPELPSSSRARAPVAAAASASPQPRASAAQSGPRPAARAGLTRKRTKKFDFPIPWNEVSRIMKKKKKKTRDEYSVSRRKVDMAENFSAELFLLLDSPNVMVLVWNSVYKVISRMLEENEKYRLRLNRQQLSNGNSNDTK